MVFNLFVINTEAQIMKHWSRCLFLGKRQEMVSEFHLVMCHLVTLIIKVSEHRTPPALGSRALGPHTNKDMGQKENCCGKCS